MAMAELLSKVEVEELAAPGPAWRLRGGLAAAGDRRERLSKFRKVERHFVR
jgi:hypothetical protein